HRSQALSARRDDVLGDLVDQHHVGRQPVADQRIDGGHVAGGKRLDGGQGQGRDVKGGGHGGSARGNRSIIEGSAMAAAVDHRASVQGCSFAAANSAAGSAVGFLVVHVDQRLHQIFVAG